MVSQEEERGREENAYQRRCQVLGTALTLGPSHTLHDVLAKRVLVDTEMQSGTSGSGGHSQICVSRIGAGEQQQVRDAEGTGHGGVIAQLVGLALFQTAGSTGLQHAASVLDQL